MSILLTAAIGGCLSCIHQQISGAKNLSAHFKADHTDFKIPGHPLANVPYSLNLYENGKAIQTHTGFLGTAHHVNAEMLRQSPKDPLLRLERRALVEMAYGHADDAVEQFQFAKLKLKPTLIATATGAAIGAALLLYRWIDARMSASIPTQK